VRFFSGTFCPPLELLRNSFIAAGKTSHTTGTLNDIFLPAKVVGMARHPCRAIGVNAGVV
jgi:hypothetical protein